MIFKIQCWSFKVHVRNKFVHEYNIQNTNKFKNLLIPKSNIQVQLFFKISIKKTHDSGRLVFEKNIFKNPPAGFCSLKKYTSKINVKRNFWKSTFSGHLSLKYPLKEYTSIGLLVLQKRFLNLLLMSSSFLRKYLEKSHPNIWLPLKIPRKFLESLTGYPKSLRNIHVFVIEKFSEGH